VAGSETLTNGARSRWPSRAVLAVAGLVVASTAIRFAAAQAFTTPWIAPDEMVYGMLGEGLWTHGTLTLRSLPSPYYSVLTPALVGAPLAAFDLDTGIQWARLLQSLAMSLVAVPTFAWTRRVASTWWAVAAAALVLTTPALHYAGFLMTEPLTLTVVTVALYMLARAIQEPSMWRYGVFVGWATAAAAVRLQALVLLPAFLLAAVIDSLAARDRARLRPLLWFGALAALSIVVVAIAIVATGGELSMRRLLGAYTPVGEAGTAAAGDRVDEVLWHAFAVAVLGLGATAVATAVVAWRVLSGRERDPATRAFVSTTLAYVGLLVVQVGLFAAVFVGTVAERYLMTAWPPLVVGMAAWVSRGAPRALWVALGVGAAIVAGAALVPIDQLATPTTLPNTPTPAILDALGDGWARAALVVAAIAAVALVLVLPRSLAGLVMLAVGVGLALLSVDSGRRIADASEHEQRVAVGSAPPSWLDDAGLRDATLLLTEDQLWTTTARTIFWNRGIDQAVRVAPETTAFPPATRSVEIDPDGVLRDRNGSPVVRDLVVAPSTFTLDGERAAERQAGDSEAQGFVAWRTKGPVRVLLRREGFLPNGDFTGTALVTVYGCRPGTLDLTILGKTGNPVDVRVDGITVAHLETAAGDAVTHHVAAPPYADGSRRCVFDLENPGYAGSTTIAFTPS
jgi:hypothetical protein